MSVELELTDDRDRAVFAELLTAADVVVENFRAGVFERLGYSWASLQQLNPALIYCSISGFGHDGPMRSDPAYDQIIQGLSGIMSITGTPQTAPVRAGFPVCDTLGGLTAAFMICAALEQRRRTSRGSRLDVSMLESALSAMGWPVTSYLISGAEPAPMGNDNATAAPSGTFRTADGLINIAANRQVQFETLCRLIGREDLITNPRFADGDRRKASRAALNAQLEQALSHRDARAWCSVLSPAGVPAAPVVSVPEALELEQVRHREFLSELPFPGDPERRLRVCGAAAHVDGEPVSPATAPPELGADNERLPEIMTRWTQRARSQPAAPHSETAGSRP
jgi:crotonobetainyl-CoA:carnitine CoA-transferase CaiB-like acyl-CoA transferase